MTVDDFTRRIESLGTELNQFDQLVLKVTGPLVDQLKAATPVDTGALKSSVGLRIVDSREFYIEMLAYGFFQNYGVKASPDSTTAYNTRQTPVEGFGLPPKSGTVYQFGTRQEGRRPWGAFYSGLNAQGFFTMSALAQQITTGLQQELNNTIQ